MRKFNGAKFALIVKFCFLVTVFLAFYFASSDAEDKDITIDESVTIRVCVECTYPGFSGNYLQENVIEKGIEDAAILYREANGNVRVELEYIPKVDYGTNAEYEESVEARQLAVENIRKEIADGKGPDIFLSAVNAWPGEVHDGVFLDVERDMRGGIFYDISEYLDADKTLWCNLNPVVMEAGRVGDAQYTLPLRYSYPVIFVDRAAAETAGLEIGTLCLDTYALYSALLRTGDPSWFEGAYPVENVYVFSSFPKVFDYDTNSIQISVGELEDYVECARSLGEGPLRHSAPAPIAQYIQNGWHPFKPRTIKSEEKVIGYGTHLYAGTLSNVLDIVATSKALGINLDMFPLRAINGDLIANVSYWGAVNANTEHPLEAYEFLRLLLTPEAQSIITARDGWPVRTDIGVEMIWSNYQKQIEWYKRGNINSTNNMQRTRVNRLLELELTENDVPLANVEITKVRFASRPEYNAWNKIFHGDIRADELYEDFYWHITRQ